MKAIFRFIFITLSILIIDNIISNSNGPGGGYSGAPSENNCTNCHGTFSLQTSGVNFNKIRLDIPMTGGGYIPDSTYLIKISYKETGKTVFGFQVTALDSKNNEAAGTFTANDSRTQTGNYTIASKTRYYAEHTSSGTSAVVTDSVAWFVKWKAPNKNVGTVRFHLNLNVANANGSTSGDYIYKKSFDFQPSSLLPKATASIKDSIICSGKSIQFQSTGTQSPTSYQWSFPSGSVTSSTLQNPTVSYTNAGNYIAILTVKNNKGQSLPDTLRFKVVQGAVKPTINFTGAVSICTGDSIRLNANNITGHTLSWMPVNNKKNSLFVKDSGTYFAVSTNSLGCTRNSDNVSVKVLQKPIAVVTPLDGIDVYCLNSSVPLKVTGKSTKIDSFSVTSASTGFTTDSNFVKKAAVLGTISFNAWVKASNGCVSAPGKVSVTVQDSFNGPSVTIVDTQLTSATLSWNHSIGSKYNYSTNLGSSWNFPTDYDSSSSETIKTPMANYDIDFWLKSLSNHVCRESKISKVSLTTLSCNPINFSVTAMPKSLSCADSILNLKLNTTLSDFKWAIDFDAVENVTSYNYKLNSGNNTIVLALMNNKEPICGYTVKQIQWNADAIPTINWTNSDLSKKYCRGNSSDTIQLPIKFNATGAWKSVIVKNSLFNQILSNGNNSTLAVVSQGEPNITYTVTTDSGCLFSDTAIKTKIQGLPSADFSISNSSGYKYKFEANNNDLLSYQWNVADSSSKQNPISLDLYNYRGNKISVKLDVLGDGNGCTNSKTDSLVVSLTNNKNFNNLSQLLVYPNPVTSGNAILIDGIIMSSKLNQDQLRGLILDQSGKCVYNTELEQIDKNKWKIETGELSAGLYFLQIQLCERNSSATTSITKPFVIEKAR